MRSMKIATQLVLGFGVMVLLVLTCSLMVWIEMGESRERALAERHSTVGAVALARAQSALWQLRYGFPQFMVSDEAARKKIMDDEPKQYLVIDQALKEYAESNPTEEERKSLQALQEVYSKYIAARPKWFELYGAGQLEEAKEWRAATTTPFGAGTVKAFTDLIELQQKMGERAHANAMQDMQTARQVMLAVALLAAVVGVVLAVTIIGGLRRQLGGEPAYAKEVASRIAEGDLATEVHVADSDRSSVLWAMKRMRDSLRTLVGEVADGARMVVDSSAQIAQGNHDLSQRTETQASTLEETASSMEELTSTVNQNADNARQATQLAEGASSVASKGGTVVGEVVTTMNGISEASRKIADIIGVIDGIAFQTNILALNAAVEAARAGEQGRGFAVVAAEVRSLAQRSAEAAKEIKALIGNSVEKVDAGTRLVDAAGRTMHEIVSSVKGVSDLISDIAAACAEQSSGIGQVNTAISQMDQVVQQNAAQVEQATAATEAMKAQAAALLASVARFNLGDAQLQSAGPTPRWAEPAAAATPAAALAPIRFKPAARPLPAAAAEAGGLPKTAPQQASWKEF